MLVDNSSLTAQKLQSGRLPNATQNCTSNECGLHTTTQNLPSSEGETFYNEENTTPQTTTSEKRFFTDHEMTSDMKYDVTTAMTSDYLTVSTSVDYGTTYDVVTDETTTTAYDVTIDEMTTTPFDNVTTETPYDVTTGIHEFTDNYTEYYSTWTTADTNDTTSFETASSLGENTLGSSDIFTSSPDGNHFYMTVNSTDGSVVKTTVDSVSTTLNDFYEAISTTVASFKDGITDIRTNTQETFAGLADIVNSIKNTVTGLYHESGKTVAEMLAKSTNSSLIPSTDSLVIELAGQTGPSWATDTYANVFTAETTTDVNTTNIMAELNFTVDDFPRYLNLNASSSTTVKPYTRDLCWETMVGQV